MKKLLGLFLVLALLVPTMPAKADVLKNLKSTGEIQVLGTLESKVQPATGQTSSTSLRVLYGLGFDLTDNVKANATFAYYNLWGQDVISGLVPVASSTHTGSSINAMLDNIRVLEANVVLQDLFCTLEAKIGRQFYGDEDSAIIYFGPNHYNSNQRDALQAKSLDAANISYAGDEFAWNFVYAKVNEDVSTVPTVPSDDGTTLYGIDAKANINDNLKVQGYFYDFRNMQNAVFGTVPAFGGDKYVGIYGAKASLGLDAAELSLEYARNVGGTSMFAYDQGNLLKIDGSLDLGEFTPRATVVRSDNFVSFGNYRPGLIFGQAYTSLGGTLAGAGYYDGNAFLQEIFVANLGVDMNFDSINKFTFSVDGFYFNPDRNLKSSPGYELDGWVKYAMTDNVELHVAAGGLHEAGVPNAYKLQTGMLIKF